MVNRKIGIFPDSLIGDMINGGMIINAKKENIGPGSMDLTLSDEAYRVSGIIHPFPGESIESLLEKVNAVDFDFLHGLPFEKDVSYLIKLEERLELDQEIHASCNAKSSAGRIGLFVRTLADGVSRYDSIPPGYKGNLWLHVCSKSFPVKFAPGQKLNQIRFANTDIQLSTSDVRARAKNDKFLWIDDKPIASSNLKTWDNDGSLIMTINLEREIIGYHCQNIGNVFDFAKTNYVADDFFKPLTLQKGQLHLEKGGFYLLLTHEAIRVPPDLACEVVAIDINGGEFRSHCAGYVDPGYGWGKKGEGKGFPITLEIVPFEKVILRPRQQVVKLIFKWMLRPPDLHYDELATSNYKQRGRILSKHFIF